MGASVYLETTIPSYLTAWLSPELVMAARQQVTRDWWDNRRVAFDLFVSQLVIDESSAGDPEAVVRRLAILDGIPLVEPQKGTDELVESLIRDLALPDRAAADAGPHCFGGGQWDRLSLDLELHAYRQRRKPAYN